MRNAGSWERKYEGAKRERKENRKKEIWEKTRIGDKKERRTGDRMGEGKMRAKEKEC